jgi:uncharacterized protein YbcI
VSQSIESADRPAADHGAIRSALANAVVRLHAEHFGRGPTRARAHLGDDHVLVLLEDVLTVAERTLVAAGRADQVVATRSAFSDAMSALFVAEVESISRRRVRAYLSRTSVEPELTAELFVLEPPPE